MSRSDYKNKYAHDHYDRIVLQVPKGKKEVWKQLAKASGVSLNEYICRKVDGSQEDILDKMQVAAKYRAMISSVSGTTKDGYTVTLKDGFSYSDTGLASFWSRTKPELRANIKKCHVHDT